MTPQTYIETDTDLQAARFREWLGRELGRWFGKPDYPIPDDPPGAGFTLYWQDPKPKVGGGGVFVLDDDIVANATQAQTLSDGHEYYLDISTNAKTHEQLSAAGQTALIPPEI